MVDQEGGRARASGRAFTDIPSARRVGGATRFARRPSSARSSPASSRDGRGHDPRPGRGRRHQPECVVIGDRAFTTEPDAVGEAAVAFIEAAQKAGAATCETLAGHGDVREDSHAAVPSSRALDRLRAVEMRPFERAVEANVAAVLVAHWSPGDGTRSGGGDEHPGGGTVTERVRRSRAPLDAASAASAGVAFAGRRVPARGLGLRRPGDDGRHGDGRSAIARRGGAGTRAARGRRPLPRVPRATARRRSSTRWPSHRRRAPRRGRSRREGGGEDRRAATRSSPRRGSAARKTGWVTSERRAETESPALAPPRRGRIVVTRLYVVAREPP